MTSPRPRSRGTSVVQAVRTLDEAPADALRGRCAARIDPHREHDHFEAAELAAAAILDRVGIEDPGEPAWVALVVWWGGGVDCSKVEAIRQASQTGAADPWWDAIDEDRGWLWCELVDASGLPRELGPVAASLVQEVDGGWGAVRAVLNAAATDQI